VIRRSLSLLISLLFHYILGFFLVYCFYISLFTLCECILCDGGDGYNDANVCCGDYGAQHEMVEALVELATMKRSPWLQDPDWSNDARSLRELAIRTPWIVTDEFVWNHFKSLCLVDHCVSECSQLYIDSVVQHPLSALCQSFRLSLPFLLPLPVHHLYFKIGSVCLCYGQHAIGDRRYFLVPCNKRKHTGHA